MQGNSRDKRVRESYRSMRIEKERVMALKDVPELVFDSGMLVE